MRQAVEIREAISNVCHPSRLPGIHDVPGRSLRSGLLRQTDWLLSSPDFQDVVATVKRAAPPKGIGPITVQRVSIALAKFLQISIPTTTAQERED